MSHREHVMEAVWDELVTAFGAGDLAKATRLGTHYDSLAEETDESYFDGLVEA